MHLTGPLPGPFQNSREWLDQLQEKQYSVAAGLPVGPDSKPGTIDEYLQTARSHDVAIAEVGAWSSPLSDNDAFRNESLIKCKRQLAFADQIGARCCVNIAGSRGEKWDGPDPRDLTDETFDLIVATVREILDDVQPTRTFYTLETMPWMFPCDADSYLDLIEAIDRPQFGVHFDPVNLINSPFRYFHNAAVIRDFVEKLGPQIRSVHVKDIVMARDLTVHLSEAIPGEGNLDYPALLTELNRLDDDLPLVMEHCADQAEYDRAARHLRAVAAELKISLL